VTALRTGDRHDLRTGGLVGPIAERAAQDILLRRLFISSAAVDPDLGSSETSPDDLLLHGHA
jgi:DeoR family fructose operon transcriptional repressor